MEDRRHNDDVILEKLDRQHSDIQEIKEQVKFTNGKVRKTDITLAYLKGAIAVVVALVIPMIVWFLNNYLLKH